MAKYEVTLAQLIPQMINDMSYGTTASWELIRDIVDAAYKGNFITEPVSDAALGGGETAWAALTAITSSKLAEVKLAAED